MLMRNPAVILGAVMLTLVAAPVLGQNVKTQKNGDAEVRYSDGCVVYYGKNGRRTDSRSGCSASQNRRADKAMAAHRQKQRMGNSSANSDEGQGECPDGPPVGLGEHAWNRCGY